MSPCCVPGRALLLPAASYCRTCMLDDAAAAAVEGSVSLREPEEAPSSPQLLKLSRVEMNSLPLSDQAVPGLVGACGLTLL